MTRQQPTHALTLSYNDAVPLHRIRADLDDLHAHVDRELLGRRFNRKPYHQRTWFAAFPEHINTNAHVHLIARVMDGRHDVFEALFSDNRNRFWAKWATRGTHALVAIFDAPGWAKYAVKELRPQDDWVLSDTFLPARITT